MPLALKIDSLPALGASASFVVTELAIVWPFTQLRLDTFGWVEPAGHTERNDGAVVSVTVTLRITASALAGTPALPATVMSRV